MERTLRTQASLVLNKKAEVTNIEDLEAKVTKLEVALNEILRILETCGYISINNSSDISKK